MDWYAFVYRASYRLGFTPWDEGVPASGLVALVEGPDALPRGRALDLGCGTGTNSIYLCKNGWTTTGVDMVPGALEAARRRAARASAAATFVEGNVTRLQDLGIGGDFDLLVDVGCFHTLPVSLRGKYVEGVSSVARTDAMLFLFAFSPRSLAPMRSGATQDEVARAFDGWDLLSGEPSSDGQSASTWRGTAARYFAPREYRLRKGAR